MELIIMRRRILVSDLVFSVVFILVIDEFSRFFFLFFFYSFLLSFDFCSYWCVMEIWIILFYFGRSLID